MRVPRLLLHILSDGIRLGFQAVLCMRPAFCADSRFPRFCLHLKDCRYKAVDTFEYYEGVTTRYTGHGGHREPRGRVAGPVQDLAREQRHHHAGVERPGSRALSGAVQDIRARRANWRQGPAVLELLRQASRAPETRQPYEIVWLHAAGLEVSNRVLPVMVG
jgi:hypothetical protein